MYGVKFIAYGPQACFTRPEMKVERVSYDVPTVSALQGLMRSIYWHPGITWYVDKIHVLNPIKFETEMHNELDSQQRNTTFLTDVKYLIEAHFTSEIDNPGKVLEIFNHRLRKGKPYGQPCFGLREYEAFIEPVSDDVPVSCYVGTNVDLGYMLYEVDYEHPGSPSSYIRLKMVDGVIDVSRAVADGQVVK